jgi:Carboxypeptidase regulatory-like domain
MQAAVVLYCALLIGQATPSTSSTSAATGRIAGRIVADGANTPIAGARIVLMPSLPPGPAGPDGPGRMMWRPLQTQTDDDGRFVFDKVEPGKYRLDVQKTGFAPVGEPGNAATADVSAGKTTNVALALQKGGVIVGKVLDAQGEPLADVRMMAMRRMNRPAGMPAQAGSGVFLVPAPNSGQQQTNDLGEYRIAGLAPGEYYVAAMPNGGMPFGGPATVPTSTGKANTTTYYPGTIDQAAAQPIKVAAGETIYNIVLNLQSTPGFRITGRVVDENGAAVAGAMVMLMSSRPAGFMGPPGHATAGDDGRFTFVDVPSGMYRVNASIPIQMNGARGGAVGSGAIASGGSVMTWTSAGRGRGAAAGGSDQPAEVTVSGEDVADVRVVVRRAQQH